MNSNRVPSTLLAYRPEVIKVLTGDDLALLKNFPNLTDGICLDDSLALMADQRSYFLAFIYGALFLVSLVPFGASIVLFAQNGLTWSWVDIGFLLVLLVCLAYVALWSHAFYENFCRSSSARICFIFFNDRLIWAEKWLRHYQSKTFLYADITLVAHGFFNGGGDVGRGFYVNHELLLSGFRQEGLCRWLYFVAENYISGREIVFRDIDPPIEIQRETTFGPA